MHGSNMRGPIITKEDSNVIIINFNTINVMLSIFHFFLSNIWRLFYPHRKMQVFVNAKKSNNYAIVYIARPAESNKNAWRDQAW